MALCLFICTGPCHADASDALKHRYVLKCWTVADGLPSNEITAIAQSDDGYIWIGTKRGLCRFDGARFVSLGSENGMLGIGVHELLSGPGGTIWMRDELNAVHIRDRRTFYRHPITARSLQTAEDGFVYGRTTRGFTGLSRDEVTEIPYPPEWHGDSISTFLRTSRNAIIAIHREAGIWQYDQAGWALWPEEPEPESRGRLGVLMEDSSGAVWISTTPNKIHKVGPGGRQVFPVVEGEAYAGLNQLIEQPEHGIWAAMQDGGLWHLENEQFIRYPLEAGTVVSRLALDKTGALWIATAGQGLIRLVPSRVQARTLAPIGGGGRVSAMAEMAPGKFVVATSNTGVWWWENGLCSPFYDEPNFRSLIYGNALLQTRDGALWVGTAHQLSKFHRNVPVADARIQGLVKRGNYVTSLCEEHDGTLWVGSGHGLYWRIRGNEVNSFVTEGPVVGIAEGHDGSVWVAVYRVGLVRWLNGKKTLYQEDSGLPHRLLTAIAADSTGGIWVGAGAAGLYGFDGTRFVNVTPSNPAGEKSSVLQIADDGAGWLWLGGDRGIQGFPLPAARETVSGKSGPVEAIRVGRADGMLDEQCTQMIPLRSPNGYLHFGTVKGFISFDPAKFKVAATPVAPLLEEVLVNGAAAAIEGGLVTIPPQSRFDIHFSIQEFLSAAPSRTRFRLTGYDKDWNDGHSTRVASYKNVTPGIYKFEVTNQALVSSEITRMILNVEVQALLVQKLWFKALLVALAAVSACSLVLLAARHAQKRKLAIIRQEKLISDERLRIASDLHDGIGAGLTQAGMMVEALGRNPENLTRALQQLKSRIRHLSQDLEETVWTASPLHDRLPSLCAFIAEYMHEYFCNSRITCDINIIDPIPDSPIKPNTRHHIFMSAKEIFNNILKHSEASECGLEISAKERHLKMIISDNGKGFHPETEAGVLGNGLRSLRHRVNSIGGDMRISSSERGTTVGISFPIFTGI